MRKFFALALAVAMVMSLAAVSFADPAIHIDATAFKVPQDYSSDDNTMANKKMIEYGDTAYFPIIVDGVQATDYDEVEKLKIKAEFEMGEDLVESISIAKKNIGGSTVNLAVEPSDFAISWDATNGLTITYIGTLNAQIDADTLAAIEADVEAVAATNTNFTFTDGTATGIAASAIVENTGDGSATFNYDDVTVEAVNNLPSSLNGVAVGGKYYYYVAMKIKKVETTGDADVIGTLEFNRKKNDEKGIVPIKDEEVDFSFNVWYDYNYNDSDGRYNTPLKVTSDSLKLRWDDMYILKFDYDEEVDIEFGIEGETEGVFTVDVSGQGKIAFKYDTKANDAICDANPGAKMYFVNFNGAKFNRTGVFEYEMEDMVAAYKVEGDKLVEINGLELDGDTATFSTRTLGNYVFADAELVNPVVEAPVVEAPAAVTNPSTGA